MEPTRSLLDADWLHTGSALASGTAGQWMCLATQGLATICSIQLLTADTISLEALVDDSIRMRWCQVTTLHTTPGILHPPRQGRATPTMISLSPNHDGPMGQ